MSKWAPERPVICDIYMTFLGESVVFLRR